MTTLLLSTNSASGQTTCEPPRICATEQLLEDSASRKAENLCAKARKKAARVDDYRTASAQAQQREAICYGRLQASLEADLPTETRAPVWLKLSLDFALVGFSGMTAGAIATDAPAALVWSSATAAVGTLAVEIIFEVLGW